MKVSSEFIQVLRGAIRRFGRLAAVPALAVLSACTGSGIPGATVRWANVPYLAESTDVAEAARRRLPTGLKVSDDWKYLYVQIRGYTAPSQKRSVVGGVGGRRRRIELWADAWRVTLDSDSMIEPRRIVFTRGIKGTVCSDSAVKFAERRHTLDLAISKAAVTTTPVHVRVERIIRLFSNGAEVARETYAFPEDGPAVYHTPTLPADRRPPLVKDVRVAELECNAAALQWVSSKRLTSRIELAAPGEVMKTACDAGPPRTDHDVLLTKLLPDTLYRFRVSGCDFSGNAAEPISGRFRTAAEPHDEPALRQIRGSWREVPMQAPAPSVSTDTETPPGTLVRTQPGAKWKLDRELPAGRYRLSGYVFHKPDGSPIEVYTVRSAELPNQLRKIGTITLMRDGKLRGFEKVLKIDGPFDRIVLKAAKGDAGPVTSLKLFEIPVTFPTVPELPRLTR